MKKSYTLVSPQSLNITGFIHNTHRVSLWFLQPFSTDSAGFPCRDPAIPSPCSFHGVKICSVFLSTSQWVEIRIHNHFGPIVLAYVLARFVHLHSFHDFLFRLVIIHIGHTLKCHFYANLLSGFSVGEIFHQTKRFYAYLACLFSSCLFLVCT